MTELERKTKAEMDQIGPILLGFPWEDREHFAMWLAQTFHMVNHSTRLVALAGAHAPLDRNDLHARFVDHAKEERGHQLIAISDIKALGYKLEDFPCLYQSAAMFQIQYYWIQHRNPVSFFGYTLALECMAKEFGEAVYRRAFASHGTHACKFLKVHAQDDIEHTEKAFEQLAKLKSEEIQLVVQNLELSTRLYRGMLVEIQSHLAAGQQQTKRAA